MKNISNTQTLSMNGLTVSLSFEVSSNGPEHHFEALSNEHKDEFFQHRFHQVQSLAAKKLDEAHQELESAFLFHSCETLSECLESERVNLEAEK